MDSTGRPALRRRQTGHGETFEVSRGGLVVAFVATCVLAGGLVAALTTHGGARAAWTVVVVLTGVWWTATLVSMLFVCLAVRRVRRARGT